MSDGPQAAAAITAVPVIAIDGPSASGKGTVAQAVAQALGFHYLDSGALYRLVALAAMRRGLDWSDETALAALAAGLEAQFEGENIRLAGEEVAEAIRSEACSAGASRVAAVPGVRLALITRQRDYRQAPGLVADGRDMGSVIFPDAGLKIFLTATAEERARRRHNQLKQKGNTAKLDDLLQDLRERDARDSARSVAPLKQGPDARLLDTTCISAAQAVAQVLDWYGAPR